MTTYNLTKKTNASSGQKIVHVNGTRSSFNPETAKPGQAVSLDAFLELENKVQEQDTKLDKILKLLENK